jgi:ATP-dependent NAD(P)H-hydrate dehydratase
MATNIDDAVLLEMVRSIVPKLSPHFYKGQCGRIAVVGGCKEYTGAPYFAAISAMKVGADLSHVICAREAAPVIKSYSPELIVHPILDSDNALSQIADLLPKMHCVVIGPGLGREEHLLQAVKGVIEKARSLKLPLVIDADGVYLLSLEPKVIHGCTQAILTPNVVEFSRLYSAVLGRKSCNHLDEVSELSRALGNVTIVKKGREDVIANARQILVCKAEGSSRRCGGQGDLLAGSMGTFSHWAHTQSDVKCNELTTYGATMCAAYAACLLTRECAKHAFSLMQRSTTTSDLIASIHHVFSSYFEPR